MGDPTSFPTRLPYRFRYRGTNLFISSATQISRMDESFLTSLLQVPGVRKRRARTLAEKFTTVEALRKASLEEIDALPGIGPALAQRLKDFAEAADSRAGGLDQPVLEAGAPLTEPEAARIQPRAESEVPVATTRQEDWLRDFVDLAALIEEVPSQAVLEERGRSAEPDPPGSSPEGGSRPEERAHPLSLCPNCGALFGEGERSCSKCSVVLVDAMDTSMELEPPEPLDEPPGTRASEGQAVAAGRISGTRFSGRTGRESAMTRATGRVNGLASRVAPGEGMVNGLINGNGISDGRARRHSFRTGGIHSRRRSASSIAIVVLMLLLVPVFAILFSEPAPPGGIVIDGRFGDWASVPRYDDTIGESSQALDISEYRIRQVDEHLLVYARVTGNLWGVPVGHTESVFAFVDGDGDPATGFQIGGMGAETAAEFYGWEGGFAGSQAWEYDDARGPASDDWRSLRRSGTLEVASAQNQIEAHILPSPRYTIDRARILFYTWSSLGEGDAADAIVGRATGALLVSQRTIAADVLGGTQEPFLAFSVRPLAAVIRLASVTVREYGSLPPSAVMGSLFLDESADGVIDPTDPMLSTAPFSPEGTFAIGRTLNAAEFYVLRADLLASAREASVGFRVVAASLEDGVEVPVTITDAQVSMSYIAAAPGNVTVDGAFADWNRYSVRVDADNDVRSASRTTEVNENIDIRAHEAVVRSNVSLYLRVDGRILGGVDIPNFRDRPPAESPTLDADGDQVPDAVEEPLGLLLAFDFNNDNVSDADQLSDVDQDGLLDYNACQATDCSAYTDYILETTIPAWYPPPYAGRVVRRYVGPVSLPAQRGVDTASVYMDRDNRSDTGLYVTVEGVPYGMDYAYQAVGRSGTILEAALYRHNASLTIPWEKVTDVPTAIDSRQLEAGFDAALVNLTANHTFVFMTTDWQSNVDTGLLGQGLRSAPSQGMRSVDGPHLFDIPGNQKLYLRSANHATETACTTNKVASPTPGPGPVASTVVRAGQSACWYADTTAGTAIPAGDWEALLDLFLSHGLAVYGEGSVANPRYREWDSRFFGPEGSANPAASTINWVVVASSPSSPEKVVGILSSDSFLYVQTWNGAVWASNWNTNLGRDQTRGFDIAYEEQSGDVVVAFGDNTAQLRYRKRVAGTWDGANGNAGTPLADVPYYVRLTPNPTNNDIMTAVATNAGTLHALRWDGATKLWGNQVQMPGILGSKDEESFDVAYERASGDAFVIWGDDGGALRYREFTAAWGAATTAYSLPDKALWVTAAADPEASSNRIAVGMILNNNDLEFGAWTGASWAARPAPVGTSQKNQRGIDVGFEATTNRAMFVFNPSSNPRQIVWRTWTQSGGFGGVTAEPGLTGNINFVQVRPDPTSNDMMLLYADNNRDLAYRWWDGATWSPLAVALEVDLSEHSQREAFMFAWTRVVEYDVHLEIWDTTVNAVVDTIGSCLNDQTYGDDVQCLVTGVGAKVLSPNQVVRLRVVHSSLGGTFGILFDVPTAIGDSRVTIPFLLVPEFEVLALPILTVLLVFGLRRRLTGRRKTSREGSRALRKKKE